MSDSLEMKDCELPFYRQLLKQSSHTQAHFPTESKISQEIVWWDVESEFLKTHPPAPAFSHY